MFEANHTVAALMSSVTSTTTLAGETSAGEVLAGEASAVEVPGGELEEDELPHEATRITVPRDNSASSR